MQFRVKCSVHVHIHDIVQQISSRYHNQHWTNKNALDNCRVPQVEKQNTRCQYRSMQIKHPMNLCYDKNLDCQWKLLSCLDFMHLMHSCLLMLQMTRLTSMFWDLSPPTKMYQESQQTPYQTEQKSEPESYIRWSIGRGDARDAAGVAALEETPRRIRRWPEHRPRSSSAGSWRGLFCKIKVVASEAKGEVVVVLAGCDC